MKNHLRKYFLVIYYLLWLEGYCESFNLLAKQKSDGEAF